MIYNVGNSIHGLITDRSSAWFPGLEYLCQGWKSMVFIPSFSSFQVRTGVAQWTWAVSQILHLISPWVYGHGLRQLLVCGLGLQRTSWACGNMHLGSLRAEFFDDR